MRVPLVYGCLACVAALALAPGGAALSGKRNQSGSRGKQTRARTPAPPALSAAALDHGRVAFLTRLLTHPSPRQRAAAADGLGRSRDLRAVAPLCAALQDGSVAVRCSAARALCEAPDTHAIPALLRGILDRDRRVRSWCVVALGKTGAPRAIRPIAGMMADPSEGVRRCAVQVIAESGQPGAAALLLTALSDRAQSVRIAAIAAVGRSRDPGAHQALLAVALSDRWPERLHAVRAARPITDKHWLGPLLGWARHPDPRMRDEACGALGELADPRAVPILLVALHDGSPFVQLSAAEALARLGEPTCVDWLVGALRMRERDTAERAAVALGVIGGTRAEAALKTLASQPQHPQCSAAMCALARCKADQGTEFLLARLRDPDGDVKSAAYALRFTGDARAVDALIPLLRRGSAGEEDDNGTVADAAASSLAAMGATRAAGEVFEAVVRGDCHREFGALEEFGAAIVQHLAKYLDDPRPEARVAGASLMARHGDATALNVLVASASDPAAETRAEAVVALAQLDDPTALGAAVAALRDPDREVRGAAAGWLADRSEPAVVSGLAASVNRGDPIVAERCCDLLIRMGRPESERTLINVLTGPSKEHIAAACLRSGNPTLVAAAHAYGRRWGIVGVQPQEWPRWGSGVRLGKGRQ